MFPLRRVLPALAIALACAAAAVWWTQVRFPAHAVAVPGVPRLALDVQDGVRASDVAAIRRGFAAQDAYLRAIGAGGIAADVDVRVADGRGCKAFETSGANGVGQTEPGWICLDLAAPAWAYQREHEPLGRIDTPAHELVHARQAELGCLSDGGAQRWRWLFEGTAVDLSYRALVHARLTTDTAAAATIRRFGAFARDVRPLASYEAGNGGDHAYARWHLAVRDLLRRSHQGPEALLRFCARAKTGAGWHAAFARTFGLSVDDFYRTFAAALPRYASRATPR
ncbi:MAG TPA: hypothetical protein VNT03_13145 [Baekduia sp.]|nr:hypothetical protein [Baekduia sp.]